MVKTQPNTPQTVEMLPYNLFAGNPVINKSQNNGNRASLSDVNKSVADNRLQSSRSTYSNTANAADAASKIGSYSGAIADNMLAQSNGFVDSHTKSQSDDVQQPTSSIDIPEHRGRDMASTVSISDTGNDSIQTNQISEDEPDYWNWHIDDSFSDFMNRDGGSYGFSSWNNFAANATEDEFKNWVTHDPTTEAVYINTWPELDKNGDGKIDDDSFSQWFNANEETEHDIGSYGDIAGQSYATYGDRMQAQADQLYLAAIDTALHDNDLRSQLVESGLLTDDAIDRFGASSLGKFDEDGRVVNDTAAMFNLYNGDALTGSMYRNDPNGWNDILERYAQNLNDAYILNGMGGSDSDDSTRMNNIWYTDAARQIDSLQNSLYGGQSQYRASIGPDGNVNQLPSEYTTFDVPGISREGAALQSMRQDMAVPMVFDPYNEYNWNTTEDGKTITTSDNLLDMYLDQDIDTQQLMYLLNNAVGISGDRVIDNPTYHGRPGRLYLETRS